MSNSGMPPSDKTPLSWDYDPGNRPELIRLGAALNSLMHRLNGFAGQPAIEQSGWFKAAVRCFEAGKAGFSKRDITGGWGALHDAERFLIAGMDWGELAAAAIHIRNESQAKLKGWRADAVKELLGTNTKVAEWLKDPSKMDDTQASHVRNAITGSLEILHGHSDNLYHRNALISKNLRYLLYVCSGLMLIAFTLSYLYAPDEDLSIGVLGAIALAGSFGAVLTSMFRLSRLDDKKIPETLLHGVITSGRPLVGAASALFVYVVLKSDIVQLVEPDNITFMTSLVLAFVSGFSEHYVIATVSKVAGKDKEEK